MINFLLGAPGGGKSYEAVAFHILPALSRGRKVITNLPLVLDAFPPEQRYLLDIRTKTLAKPEEVDWQKAEHSYRKFGVAAKVQAFNPRPFANLEDYGDAWRHEGEGFGPLYVIDECHLALRRGATSVPVEEWFSLHRHEFADVLLITQSYGKVSKPICDLVQTVYRVRKAVAFGSSGSYIRKVYDGLQGDNVNTAVRKYEKRYFKFYKSHTRSGAGKEEGANDITPLWMRWPFLGLGLFVCIFLYIVFGVGVKNPMKVDEAKFKRPATVPVHQVSAPPGQTPPSAGTSTAAAVPGAAPIQAKEGKNTHPLSGYGVHLNGYIQSAHKALYMFAVSQNGQAVFSQTQGDMESAGYKVHALNSCLAELEFDQVHFFVMCDAPKIGLSPGASMPGNVSASQGGQAVPTATSEPASQSPPGQAAQGGGAGFSRRVGVRLPVNMAG